MELKEVVSNAHRIAEDMHNYAIKYELANLWNCVIDNIEPLREALDVICKHYIPEEEVKDGWHPVSEDPPKKKSHYWVQLCDSDGKYVGMHECIWTNSGLVYTNTKTDWHWIGNPQFTKVVAWRKLPDIYIEEKQ